MPPEAAPEFIEGQVPPLPGLPEHVAFRLKEPPKATQVALGKYLFFDNSLSGDQKLSCATCHQPALAWTDGLPLSKGYPATLYFRNTPTLLDAAAQPTLYWDGRFASDDLESLVRDHITEAHFMNADGQLVVERLKQKPQYEELFQATLGGEPSFGRMLKAVATYVGSLTSPPGPYDRYLAGESNALSPEAQRGLALFEGQAGCARCHNGPLLSDGEFHNLGVPENPAIFQEPLRHITFRRFFRTLGVPNYRNLHQDVGLYALTGADEDWGRFRTPSLRTVAFTAPYMHNGVFATLEEVMGFYNQGGGDDPNGSTGLTTGGSTGLTTGKDPMLVPLNLTDEEVAALVAFLKSLSGELMLVEEPEFPGFQLMNLGGKP
jgi:cytochrome c peroxidase